MCRHPIVSFVILSWLVVFQAVAVQRTMAAKGPEISIKGNLVLVDQVYKAVLDLPPAAKTNRVTANIIRRQLMKFLRKSGYVLASVQVAVVGESLLVTIDEGRLEKIIFRGSNTLTTLQLKLTLELPKYVFNKHELERQLREREKSHNIKKLYYRLVESGSSKRNSDMELGSQKLGGFDFVRPAASYELHIYLADSEWDTGFGVDLEYAFPDGLTLGGHYKGEELFFRSDRWRLGGKVGTTFREDLQDGETYISLSIVHLDAKWYSPPLIGKGFRPFLWVRNDLISRQRKDLDVEIYYSESVEGSLNLGYEFQPGLMLSFGGGMEGRFIFDVEQLPTPVFPISSDQMSRPFVLGRLEMVFDPEELRSDRRHQLSMEGRYYWVEGNEGLGTAKMYYRKIFSFGWNDMVIKSQDEWLWGIIGFYDEEPVGGRHTRGTFGNEYYVHKVVSLGLDFRFSLARDHYKLSIFHDLAVFGKLDRTNNLQESVKVANSFGAGLHMLILDFIQLDFYYGFGFSTEKTFSHGPAASLKKVF